MRHAVLLVSLLGKDPPHVLGREEELADMVRLRAVAKKGYVVGMDFVEVLPSLDVHNLTSRLAVRLILNMIGALAHAGRVG